MQKAESVWLCWLQQSRSVGAEGNPWGHCCVNYDVNKHNSFLIKISDLDCVGLTVGTARKNHETFMCDNFWCAFVKVYSCIPVRNRNGDFSNPSDPAGLRAASVQFLGSTSGLAGTKSGPIQRNNKNNRANLRKFSSPTSGHKRNWYKSLCKRDLEKGVYLAGSPSSAIRNPLTAQVQAEHF